MSSQVRCSQCNQLVPAAAGSGPIRCPTCNREVARPLFDDEPGPAPPAGAAKSEGGAPWWIGDPASSPSATPAAPAPIAATTQAPRVEAPKPAANGSGETSAIRTAPVVAEKAPSAPASESPAPVDRSAAVWGTLALLFGVAAFGLCWVPAWRLPGLLVGAAGLFIGTGVGVQRILARGNDGTYPLTAGLFNVQAIVLALVFLLAPSRAQTDENTKGSGNEGKGPQNQGTRGDKTRSVAELVAALKDDDPVVRARALAELGDIAKTLTEQVPVLADKLNDDDDRVREAALVALAAIGPQAKGAYPAILHVKDNDLTPAVRRAAETALDKIGRPTATDAVALSAGLKHPNAGYRAAVAQTLAMLGRDAKPAEGAIAEALRDKDPRVRVFAAQSLWMTSRAADKVIPVLHEAFTSEKDASVRCGAAMGLGAIGREARVATKDLEKGLGDADAGVRLFSAQALWSIEHKAGDLLLDRLKEALRDPDAGRRAVALDVLARMGPEAKGAVRPLVEVLKRDSLELRAMAAAALGLIGPEARDAVPDLVNALGDRDTALRAQVLHALLGIGPDAKGAVEALVKLLKEERDASLRGRACRALAAIGPGAADAVAVLTDKLEDGEPTVRLFAAQALCAIDRDRQLPVCIPVLCALLEEEEMSIRYTAADTLGRIGPPAKAAFPSLHRLQRDAQEAVQQAAEQAIERIGRPGAKDVDDLVKALEDSDNPRYRRAVVETLWLIGPDAEKAVQPLIDAVSKDKGNDDDKRRFRLAVIEALQAIGPKAKPAVRLLVELFNEKDPPLRAASADALGAIGADAKEAVPHFIKALQDKKTPAEVKGPVVMALAAMGKEAKAAVDVLIDVLRSNDEEMGLKAQAAYALGSIGEPAQRAVPTLKKALDLEHSAVRFYAGQALCFFGEQRTAYPVLKKLITDPDAEIRTVVAEFFGNQGPFAREVYQALSDQSKVETNDRARAMLREAMKKIGAPK